MCAPIAPQQVGCKQIVTFSSQNCHSLGSNCSESVALGRHKRWRATPREDKDNWCQVVEHVRWLPSTIDRLSC